MVSSPIDRRSPSFEAPVGGLAVRKWVWGGGAQWCHRDCQQLKNRQRKNRDGEAEVDKFINDNNEDDEVDDNINN